MEKLHNTRKGVNTLGMSCQLLGQQVEVQVPKGVVPRRGVTDPRAPGRLGV